jgi:mono/diheme cytochrome c family protein
MGPHHPSAVGDRRRQIALWTMAATLAILPELGCQRSSPPNPPDSERNTATSAASGETPAKGPDSASQSPGVPGDDLGKQLFARHCAACHGDRGDGKGIAATFLFPKPRDIRAGRFRLVSTTNGVPTRDDLQAVLLRGMPGSAMPPWRHLSQQERDALVDEVMRIRHDGARENYIKSLKDDEGLSDEEIAADTVQKDIQDYVDRFTTPGESTIVPEIPPATAETIDGGKTTYAKNGCIQCHGADGRGDVAPEMKDQEGMPTRPRDFTLGIFKGNPDPASLYRRIAYGMPGTPMPASTSMTPDQMVGLVHYLRSMSSEAVRQAAVLNRERIVAKTVGKAPESETDDVWSGVAPVQLHLAPLWWRRDASHELAVQAIHDKDTIAVRMTWQDETNDRNSAGTGSFKDAVAMELFRGPAEPFLGMGDPKSPVDVWFWDADRQDTPATVEDVHPNMVVDQYPLSEKVVDSAELNRAGARTADQPDISLPARASGNLIVPANGESGGTSLHAGGPGSLTFRMPQNQSVWAHGTWSNGRWTVVMKRPLAVPSASDGIALDPGGQASIAFAVWDGSHRDRNGQKSITIWQDFELEK